MKVTAKHHPVWAEVDLGAIAHNLKMVKQLIKPSTKIMAVVKANGYGHGATAVGQTAIELGASALGVARASEAITLRKSGLTQPILVFGYTPPSLAVELREYDITQTIFSLEYASLLNQNVGSVGGRLKVHLKIDTGMGRLGLIASHCGGKTEKIQFNEQIFWEQCHQISQQTNLQIDGVYTHFAASDSADKSSAQKQLDTFKKALEILEDKSIHIPIKHAANSGAVIDLPESHFDMVRPGVMLYGLYPSSEVDHDKCILKPAMRIKARIAQIKEVPKGFTVSYGHTYTTPEATRLATIPIGYGDGYSRQLSSSGTMLVKGKRVPIVGRVCMDQTIVDVGHVDGIDLDDEVVILGQQEGECVSADEIAQKLGTINYEIVTALLDRVPRVMV